MILLAILCVVAAMAVQHVAAALPRPARHHHRHRRRRPDPPLRTAIASWYGFAGAVGACGALQPNGLANLALPCGTRLRICAARCAAAVVDDRGPYVAGREFDLSITLAEDIGFDLNAGVGPVRWRLDG